MKKITTYMFLILLISSIVSAQTVLYSEKFRVDTSQEPTQIIIPIKIKDAVDLYGIKLDVEYDSTVMEFTDVESDEFLLEGGVSLITNSVLEAEGSDILETSSGLVKNIIVLRSAVETGVSGDGIILNLNFNKLTDAVSDITLSNVQLSDADATEISYEIYYLKYWSNPNVIEKDAQVTFYSSYEDSQNNLIQGSCLITIEGNQNQMNVVSDVYTYSTSISTIGYKQYEITCDSFYTVSDVIQVIEQDADGDGISDNVDNCVDIFNSGQGDSDLDTIGDACDVCINDPQNDIDSDNVCANVDNCPTISNTDQTNTDNDAHGDVCDSWPTDPDDDLDGDGIPYPNDNCVNDANPSQADCDEDDIGNACDGSSSCSTDTDGDGVFDSFDNCAEISNDQSDTDIDGLGDACDDCPSDPQNDIDSDTICADMDNCPTISNLDQINTDNDAYGDACDSWPTDPDNDVDGDGIEGPLDNCPEDSNENQGDCDTNGVGDVCDLESLCVTDSDGDGVVDSEDICPNTPDANQEDYDGDGLGDACDVCEYDENNDIDTDGVCGDTDNCPSFSNSNQDDEDDDGLGDACDSCPEDPDNDQDIDGKCSNFDNCVENYNPGQEDCDEDEMGDVCDLESSCSIDSDNDGLMDNNDNCYNIENPLQEDTDTDGVGDVCDLCEEDYYNDVDTDGICGNIDNCGIVANPDQKDTDGDGYGDLCDKCPTDATDTCGQVKKGSGGGFSGGGSRTPSICVESWACVEWSTCSNSKQIRTCEDGNECGSQFKKPKLSQDCTNDCKDGIKNNDEEGIDCGGSCDACPGDTSEEDAEEPTSSIKEFHVLADDEKIKEGKVTISYDNTDDKKRTGVFFNLEIKDLTGNVIAEEYFGPITIEENETYEKNLNLPTYLLDEGKDYLLSAIVSEKGIELGSYETNVNLSESNQGVFIKRSGGILVGFIILVIAILIIVSNYMKKVVEE